MKKIAFFILSVCIFAGCSSHSEKKSEREMKEAVEKAENSERVEDELFLGFKVGMSRYEADDHFEYLKSTGKIYTNISDHYRYDLKTGLVDCVMGFMPLYYNDTLFGLLCPFHNDYMSDGDYIFAVQFFLESERFESGFRFYITKDIIDKKVYTFVKDNLVVRFESNSMVYYDAPTYKAYMRQKAEEKERQIRESSSDF